MRIIRLMVKKVPDELAVAASMEQKTNSRWQCIRLNRSPGSAHWQSRGNRRGRLAICLGSVRVMFRHVEADRTGLPKFCGAGRRMKSPPNTAGSGARKRSETPGGSAGIRPQTVLNNEMHQFPRSVTSLSQKRFPQTADKFRFVGEAAFSPD